MRLLSAVLSHTVIPGRKWCVEFFKGNTGSKEGKNSSSAAWKENGWKAEFALSIDFFSFEKSRTQFDLLIAQACGICNEII